jgi:hypothetical protein
MDARARSSIVSALVATTMGCASSAPAESTNPPVFPADPLTSVVSTDGVTRVEVRTAPAQPPSRGVVDVELAVRDLEGAPMSGLSLDVVPWMIAHGHGASSSPTVVDEHDGRYWVRDVDLFMPGAWDLRVQISGAVHTQADVLIPVQ